MTLNKQIEAQVKFACFCINEGFNDPYAVGGLCQLVKQRAKLARRGIASQKDEAKDDKLIEKIKLLAQALGLVVEFPDCFASLTKDGKQIFLPL